MPLNAFKNRLVPGILLALALYFLPVNAKAQEVDGAGSTSTNFLKIGEGARAVGMGEAFTGVSDDVTAIFWNPAGLVLARGTQFNLTTGEWLQGVTTEFFAFSQNLERDGAFGGCLAYLGTGSFPNALEDSAGNYAGTNGLISASDYAGSVAYSQRLGNWISGDFFKHSMLGLRATVVGQNVVSVGSAGVAFDLGYMYEIERKKIYLGAVLSNLGTQIESYSEPLNYVLGGSYQLHNFLMKKDRDILSLDADGYNDTGINFNVGDEYQMTFGRNDVALRAGFHTASTQDLGGVAGLTAGIGIAHRFDDFSAALDYAYEPYGVLGDTNRISLTVIIGGELTKPQAFSSGPPAFVLGQNSVPVNFSTKSEEPINHWKVTVTDSSGMPVYTQSGDGNPPSKWIWQGKNQAGDLVPQGNYTVNLEVTDDNELSGKTAPHDVYAKWVPKQVPYSYAFSVPGDLLFDSAKADLQPRGYETIKNAVDALKQRYPNSTIIIAGNTDNQKLAKGAKFADNQALSLARAQAVRDFLVREGMDPNKLQVQGFGDTKPVADNATKEGRAKNRRVDLIVSGEMTAGADRLIADGRQMMVAQRYRDALDRFLRAIRADSRNGTAYHLAGDCYLILGGKDQAIQAYRMALKYNPNDTAVKAWLDKYAPSPNPAPSAPPAGSISSPQSGTQPSGPAGSPQSGSTSSPPAAAQPTPHGLTPINPTDSTAPPPAASDSTPPPPAGVPQPVQ